MFLLLAGMLWLAVALWLRELAARPEFDLTPLHWLLLPRLVLRQLGITRLVILYCCVVASGFLLLMHRLT